MISANVALTIISRGRIVARQIEEEKKREIDFRGVFNPLQNNFPREEPTRVLSIHLKFSLVVLSVCLINSP